MPRLYRSDENPNQLMFMCPGCGCGHAVRVNGDRFENGAGWQWNGDLDHPTFSPSIMVTSKYGVERKNTICHSFVNDGKIQFLHDCTHQLAGQTVELPEFE